MGFLDNIKDLIRKPFEPPPPPKQTDPMAMLAQLQGSMGAPPSSQDLYNDALNQVGGAYQAQIGNLNAQAGQAKARQKTGDAQIAAMYAALQKDIGKNAGVISGNYNAGIAASKKGTAETTGRISKTYSDTNKELASLFSRLGIQAAAPDALSGSNSDRGFLSGIANINGQSDVNALGRDKAAGLTYNTAQQNIAGLTGKEKRSGLLTQLNEALFGIGQQRNTVMGQMRDAVSQRQYQLENDAMDRQSQLQDMMFKMSQDQGGQSSNAPGGLSPSQQYAQMGPTEKGFAKASTFFGPDNASYAMRLVNGVANNQNGGIYQNISHFIRSVLAENVKQQQAGNQALDPDELEALASYFWDEGGTGRRQPSPQY